MKQRPRAEAELKSPCVPRSCEKIGGRPSRASGRTVKYLNSHGAISFVVRLSNHERIFSQLPLFQKGDFSVARLPLFEKEGKGRFSPEIVWKIIW